MKTRVTALSGMVGAPKQGCPADYRSRRANRKPLLFSRYLCLPNSIICPPHLGEGCAPAARWPAPRVRFDQLLMAMRLTCDCAFSVFGKVTVNTPFLKVAST